MITQVLHCPYCQGSDIVRHGTSSEGKQRYRCRECQEGGYTECVHPHTHQQFNVWCRSHSLR